MTVPTTWAIASSRTARKTLLTMPRMIASTMKAPKRRPKEAFGRVLPVVGSTDAPYLASGGHNGTGDLGRRYRLRSPNHRIPRFGNRDYLEPVRVDPQPSGSKRAVKWRNDGGSSMIR